MIAEPAGGANVAALFGRAAARREAAPAIVGPDGRVIFTFGELAETAARLAGGLARLGVGVGDRVLVLEPDLRRRYALVAGILWAGAAVTVPPASLPPWDAAATAATAGPRAVVFGRRAWPAILGRGGLRRVPIRIVTSGPCPPGAFGLGDLERARPIEPLDVPSDAPALVAFTTGSSGPAKAVIRSHGVLRAQHDALGRVRSLSDADRDLVGLPFLALHNLGSGVTSVLPPPDPGSSTFGTRVAAALERTRATSAAGFPHLFEAAVAGAPPARLGALRAIHVGGDRVTPTLLRALGRVAPDTAVTVVYGSTEIEPISAITAPEYLDALSSSDPAAGTCVGRVVAGLELRIQPTDPGTVATVAPGAGAILARGRRVARDPGADGWVASGDAGWLDAEGRLWLLGRTENTVGSLYSFQVERAVEALDGVRRAAFVRIEAGPRVRGMLAVEPSDWGRATTRAGLEASIRQLTIERAWAIDEVILVRRMPVIAGAAAKVDVARLARGAPRH